MRDIRFMGVNNRLAASKDANLAITRSNLLHFPSSDRSSSQASEYFPQPAILDTVGAEAVEQVLQFRGHYLPSSLVAALGLLESLVVLAVLEKLESLERLELLEKLETLEQLEPLETLDLLELLEPLELLAPLAPLENTALIGGPPSERRVRAAGCRPGP